jgi:hypothetical protein
VLDGKPTIVLSYSTRHVNAVAKPIAELLHPLGFRTVLVGAEPLPPGVESNPNSKVEWFFRHADMAVYLATPDDRLQSGETQTRPNIIDEHRLGQQMPHLRHRLLVFKAAEVTLPSNINPVYEDLPLDDPQQVAEAIVAQAQAWGVLPSTSAARPESVPASSDEGTQGSVPAGPDDATATTQARTALAEAIDAVAGDARQEDQSFSRAQLAIAGLIAERGGSDPLGVHLANSLFADRHRLRVRTSERLVLIRTYLLHGSSINVPGAFWLSGLTKQEVVGLLFTLAREDSEDTVRSQALRILGKLENVVDAEELGPLLQMFLTGAKAEHRSVAVEVIRRRRNRRFRALIDRPDLLEWDRHEISQTLALIDLARQPSAVMDRYIEDAYVRCNAVREELLAAASRIRRATVMTALQSSVEEVRLLAMALAEKKQMFSGPLGLAIIEGDRSPKVRFAALRHLVDATDTVDLVMFSRATDKREDDLASSADLDEKHAIEVELCRRLPDERLREGVKWASVRGPAFYEALGLRDPEWTKQVRRDLRDDFARLKSEGRAEMLAVFTSAETSLTERDHAALVEYVEKKYWNQWVEPELGGYLVRLFRRAALRILVSHGRPSDIRFARHFASNPDSLLRSVVLELFERFGTSRDAMTVLGLADEFYDHDERHRAAKAAFRLAYKKDKLAVLEALWSNRTEKEWAVSQLAALEGGTAKAWQLLRSEHLRLRSAAAQVVWDTVDPRHADGLLSAYMEYHHYYSVVVAVDRRLYAPRWLAPALPADN